MQKSFGFTLTGKNWFLLFLFLYLLMAVIIACSLEIVTSASYNYPALITVFCCIGIFIVLLCIIGWCIKAYRKFINRIEFNGRQFKFNGSIPAFIGMNLLGIFLSIITLTIYLPWYIRKIMNYIITQIDYDGKRLEFKGRGGELFVTMLWAYYIPLIILIAFSLAFRNSPAGMPYRISSQVLAQILFIPFGYKIYQWMFNNTSWQGRSTGWNTQFWPSVGFMLGQLLLTLITFFIYWPAAYIRIYRYFAARTEIHGEGRVLGRFEFQGKTGRGFLLIWGQALLILITLGIYLPWGAVKIYKWVLEDTFYLPAK